MKLFIIRHAESQNNRLATDLSYDEYMARRSADPAITDLGHKQAQALADYLANGEHPEQNRDLIEAGDEADNTRGYHFTHFYSSAMLRTLQTAKPVAAALGMNPEVWLDIHEHGGVFLGNPRNGDLTIYPGLTRGQMEEQFPGYLLPPEITAEGWWRSEYEDMPACYARATRVARRLRKRAVENAAKAIDERIAMVAHGTFIDSLLKAFFNQIPDTKLYYHHYNTAITRIDFMDDGTLFLHYLNRTEHLSADMISE